MDTIITALSNNEYLPAIIILVVYVCVYFWKHYQKVLKISFNRIDKNNEILNEINEISKSSRLTEEIIYDNIDKLTQHITGLETRLYELEKICINNNIANKQVMNEISNIRKNIEMFHQIEYIKDKKC